MLYPKKKVFVALSSQYYKLHIKFTKTKNIINSLFIFIYKQIACLLADNKWALRIDCLLFYCLNVCVYTITSCYNNNLLLKCRLFFLIYKILFLLWWNCFSTCFFLFSKVVPSLPLQTRKQSLKKPSK